MPIFKLAYELFLSPAIIWQVILQLEKGFNNKTKKKHNCILIHETDSATTLLDKVNSVEFMKHDKTMSIEMYPFEIVGSLVDPKRSFLRKWPLRVLLSSSCSAIDTSRSIIRDWLNPAY